MQMIEVLIDQVGVFLQVGVQPLHDEADGVSVQLGAQELGKHLRGCGGQQVSTGTCVSTAASCVQSLAKLIGIGGLEVDGDVRSSAAGLWARNGWRFLVTLNLRKKMVDEVNLQWTHGKGFVGKALNFDERWKCILSFKSPNFIQY